jgi:protein KRI1
LIYDKEQRELRESLKRSIAAIENDSDDEEPLLKLRKKTNEEIEREDKDYVRWLEGKEGSKLNRQMAEDMSALRRYWTDPNLDEDERFLRDYILHKGYIDKDAKRIPTYDELVGDHDHHDDIDEEEVEKQEQFERKYNFRFEEPESDKIVSYPRNITGSVRVQNDSRKIKRKERQSRKERVGSVCLPACVRLMCNYCRKKKRREKN